MAKASSEDMGRQVEPRRGMPARKLAKPDFVARYEQQFVDPAFDAERAAISRIADIAWDAYEQSRKSPVTRAAGAGHHDPSYALSTDWLAAREAIRIAQSQHDETALPPRILLINASSRTEHTCPGEMSKSYRLVHIAAEAIAAEAEIETDLLDLSRLASEYGRKIHPCKACFSTAAPLCHWPCSCYPNHSLGQTQDWMNEIYPMWVRAHGVMSVTPVNWYHTSSPMKLMIDRLVCADGGNPDPTRTHGKDAGAAKTIELQGWDYPRHLKGRFFAIVAHGDTEGAAGVRRSLADWLEDMELRSAGHAAELDRYIGYWKSYATNHEELDADSALREEVRIAARAPARAVTLDRQAGLPNPAADLPAPRQK